MKFKQLINTTALAIFLCLTFVHAANAHSSVKETKVTNATYCIYDGQTEQMHRDNAEGIPVYSFNGSFPNAELSKSIEVGSSENVINNHDNEQFYIEISLSIDDSSDDNVSTELSSSVIAPQTVIIITNLEVEGTMIPKHIMLVDSDIINTESCHIKLF